MPIPIIKNLKAENWAELNSDQRMKALQDLENELATQEGREPCLIELIPEGERVLDKKGKPFLQGSYDPRKNPPLIVIDPSIILSDQPYLAVEIFFHEARHAYQDYAVQHPEIHNDSAEFEVWRKNNGAGYIDSDSKLNFSYYRWQPIENDANEVGRERTEELFVEIFQDEKSYPVHRAAKLKELDSDKLRAQFNIGPNFEEKAKEAVLEKHQKNLEENHFKSIFDKNKERTSEISSFPVKPIIDDSGGSGSGLPKGGPDNGGGSDSSPSTKPGSGSSGGSEVSLDNLQQSTEPTINEQVIGSEATNLAVEAPENESVSKSETAESHGNTKEENLSEGEDVFIDTVLEQKTATALEVETEKGVEAEKGA
ncbi:MAG: hypothetical protein ABUK01_09785, partial [Leptospirales bacterium]